MTPTEATVAVIAQLITPARMGALDGQDQIMRSAEGRHRILQACARNKVPLLSLDPSAPGLEEFHQSPEMRAAVHCELAQLQNQRSEYLPVQTLCEQAGVRCVLIKSVGLAPSLPYKSDNLDVLVPATDGDRVRAILLGEGYVEVRNVEEPAKFLFRKFHLGESCSAIHLHESVGWGTGFLDDDQVLANARAAPDDPTLMIPSPEHAVLITMAHAFFEDKAVKLADLWKVRHVLQHYTLDWDAMHREVGWRGWRDGLQTCVALWAALEQAVFGAHSFPPDTVTQADQLIPAFSRAYLSQCLRQDPVYPCAISFWFSKRHYYQKVLWDCTLVPRRKCVDIVRHSLAGLKRRLPYRTQPRMLVTFSGLDGAGKTTHAQALVHALTTCEVDARLVWSRGGSSRFMERAIALFKPSLSRMATLDMSPTPRARALRKRVWLQRPLVRWGWEALFVTDLIVRYWRCIALPLLVGRVIVADRYYYDALVEMADARGASGAVPAWALAAFRLLCPRADVAVLLSVSPEEAWCRKPEEDLEFLTSQAALYNEVSRRCGLRVVDGNGQLGSTCDVLTRQVLERYMRDWHTLVAGLFWANPARRRLSDGR